ncbi:MAG: outer membrane beta-barrel protein [Steroidobacter sp.]
MKRGSIGCAATAVLMFVSLGTEIAEAAEATGTNERGFYLGAAAGRVEQDAKGEGQILVGIGGQFGFAVMLTPVQTQVDDIQTGWNVTLGYRVNKYLAAEVAYHDFGEASVVERYVPNFFPLPSEIIVRSNIEAFGPSVSLLGTVPVTPSLDVFVRGGVLFLDQEVERQFATLRSTQRTGDEIWMVGAGAQWSFASRWAARLEYQLTDDMDYGGSLFQQNRAGTEKIEQLSLGVLFDF